MREVTCSNKLRRRQPFDDETTTLSNKVLLQDTHILSTERRVRGDSCNSKRCPFEDLTNIEHASYPTPHLTQLTPKKRKALVDHSPVRVARHLFTDENHDVVEISSGDEEELLHPKIQAMSSSVGERLRHHSRKICGHAGLLCSRDL